MKDFIKKWLFLEQVKILILNIMKRTLVLLILLVLASCGKDPKNELPLETVTDAITADTIVSKGNIYIKDRSQYSPEWIADVEANEPGYRPIKIINDYMLIENDTAYFDTSLKLKQDYRFTAFTDSHFYQLTVKRINYTTVEYDFTLFKDEESVFNHKGKAHLGSYFFLGDETFNDEEEGIGYLATEYYDKNPDGLVVDIGEPDEEGRIRANIKGLPANINANTDITLRQSH